jgi:hypothetical protein
MSVDIKYLSIVVFPNDASIAYKSSNKEEIVVINSTSLFLVLQEFFAVIKANKIENIVTNIGPGKLIAQRNTVLASTLIAKYYRAKLFPISLFDTIKVHPLSKEPLYIATIKGTAKGYYFVYCAGRKALSEISIATEQSLKELGLKQIEITDNSTSRLAQQMITLVESGHYYQYRFKKYREQTEKPPQVINLTLINKVI